VVFLLLFLALMVLIHFLLCVIELLLNEGQLVLQISRALGSLFASRQTVLKNELLIGHCYSIIMQIEWGNTVIGE
jgi:hypothetical protein